MESQGTSIPTIICTVGKYKISYLANPEGIELYHDFNEAGDLVVLEGGKLFVPNCYEHERNAILVKYVSPAESKYRA